MKQLGGMTPVEQIRRWKLDANQRLLGDTIEITDQQWHQPSLLPGWTRAHVATHLARNADRLRELTIAALTGAAADQQSGDDRFTDLERGAERSGLELQIDLDTTAGRLGQVWDDVSDWHRPIHFEGRVQPLAVLPLARLHEVSIHHIDLDCGFRPYQVEPEAAGWLLSWVFHRLQGSWSGPGITLSSDSGQTGQLGEDPVQPVSGSDAELWAWLSGRCGPEKLTGTDYRPPLLG